jgi:hypothetical protein
LGILGILVEILNNLGVREKVAEFGSTEIIGIFGNF